MIRFDTSDPGQFVEELRPVTPPFSVVPTGAQFSARGRMLPRPGIGLFIAELCDGNVVVDALQDTVSVNIPLKSGIDTRVGRSRQDIAVGHAAVGMPDEELDLRFRGQVPLFVANIDADLLRSYTGGALPRIPREISLASSEGARLFRILNIYWSEGSRRGSALGSEVAAEQMRQFIVESLVSAVPSGSARAVGRVEANRIVSLAKAYIRDEISAALTVADIAEAARTSTRTLHRVFLVGTGLTPMAYVKRERLNAVRRCLLSADPGEITVTQAARRHGFSHPGRFSVVYREVFCESPSETLLH